MRKTILPILVAAFSATAVFADDPEWLHFATGAGGEVVQSVKFAPEVGRLTFGSSTMHYADNSVSVDIPYTGGAYIYFGDAPEGGGQNPPVVVTVDWSRVSKLTAEAGNFLEGNNPARNPEAYQNLSSLWGVATTEYGKDYYAQTDVDDLAGALAEAIRNFKEAYGTPGTGIADAEACAPKLVYSSAIQQVALVGCGQASSIALYDAKGSLLRVERGTDAISTQGIRATVVVAKAVCGGQTIANEFIIK